MYAMPNAFMISGPKALQYMRNFIPAIRRAISMIMVGILIAKTIHSFVFKGSATISALDASETMQWPLGLGMYAIKYAILSEPTCKDGADSTGL